MQEFSLLERHRPRRCGLLGAARDANQSLNYAGLNAALDAFNACAAAHKVKPVVEKPTT